MRGMEEWTYEIEAKEKVEWSKGSEVRVFCSVLSQIQLKPTQPDGQKTKKQRQ